MLAVLFGVEKCWGIEFDRVKVDKSRSVMGQELACVTDLVDEHRTRSQQALFPYNAAVPRVKFGGIGSVSLQFFGFKPHACCCQSSHLMKAALSCTV